MFLVLCIEVLGLQMICSWHKHILSISFIENVYSWIFL